MVNTDVKGQLAKLLATENITVEHRQVSTACFDVEKRLLILPIWNASSTVYDLLVGHEVGHALYTPPDDFGDVPKSFVNVLEDVRIEKMMKVTYPGLRKTFFQGYGELWDRDFFGVRDEDITKLPFIDRINLYYKGCNDIEFTLEEEVFVRRAGLTKTFEDVISLANDLYDYCESKQDEKDKEQEAEIENPNLVDDGSAAGDGQFDIDSSDDDGDAEEDQNSEDDLTDEQLLDEITKPDFGDPNAPAVGSGADIDREYRETESVTDESFTQALETLVDDSAKEWVYVNIPNVDVDKLIIPSDKIQTDLMFYFEGHAFRDKEEQEWYTGNLDFAKKHYRDFKKNAQKTVNYLVKQFEMKKSADNYKRQAVSKTGVINTNALFKYKITDDIFKKITTIQDGKNHGLVMYLDWSGSMSCNLLDTLKQTYNLIWFCKKAGIPFRVYAFQSGWNNHEDLLDQKPNELYIPSDVKLLEFFSSKQNAKSLEKSLLYTYLQAFSMSNHRIGSHSGYGLGGTPLVEAVLCTRKIVERLKKVENVSKVNVICLTDGESNPMSYVKETDEDDYYGTGLKCSFMCHSRGKVFFLRDPKTGYTQKITGNPYQTTSEIVGFHKQITDYNWIGIRLCSKSEMNRIARYFSPEEFDKIDKQWRKDKFASVKDTLGFTEAFFMPDRGIGDETQNLEVKQKGEVATRAELNRAFKKHMGSKMTNKTVLNSFIEQIA
mgnify:CR=1 FL=1|tara:strand:- start:531 stop:2684 length:2154 start_codon:yes stop_codon:yes gene_type:complete